MPARVKQASFVAGLVAVALIGGALRAQERPIAVQLITVREGDTLEAIALRHGTSIEALAHLNGLTDPNVLQVGQQLRLPGPAAGEAQAALLLSPAERRDRAEIAQRDLSGQAHWKWFGGTAVDWSGWRLHPGGVRITLVRPDAADVGMRRAGATAVAVQCSSLRQTWRVDGTWEPWTIPTAGSVGLRIVLDLCSNTLDGPAVPVPPPT